MPAAAASPLTSISGGTPMAWASRRSARAQLQLAYRRSVQSRAAGEAILRDAPLRAQFAQAATKGGTSGAGVQIRGAIHEHGKINVETAREGHEHVVRGIEPPTVCPQFAAVRCL